MNWLTSSPGRELAVLTLVLISAVIGEIVDRRSAPSEDAPPESKPIDFEAAPEDQIW
jgi:hypothetical protein